LKCLAFEQCWIHKTTLFWPIKGLTKEFSFL